MKAVLGKLNGEQLHNIAARAAPFTSEVVAAVAYAEGPDHPLLKSCKERGLKLEFFGLLEPSGGASSALLKELLSWGPSKAKVYLVNGHFHTKVIWWRGYGAYIGSANLTNNGWTNNIEAGVFVEDRSSSSRAWAMTSMR